MEIAINVVLTVVGLAMLCFGGNWLVSGGVAIAKKLRISKLIIGMTVVAYGTSTPELAASIAAVGEHTGIILGNIVGSNISNIGMVIGISAILIPLVAQKSVIRKEVPIMIGVSLLLIAMSLDGQISQYEGAILIAALIGFTIFIYRDVKKQRQENDDTEPTKTNLWAKSIGLIALGIAALYVGAIITVDNAVIIAQSFGISERIIGLTVIAIGTSLPELITSVIAIKKGHTDIGIGNIIGSNIYNILMIMGIASAIAGITIMDEIYFDYVVMIAFSIVLFATLKSGIISRKIGIGLAISYVVYLGYTLLL